MQLKSQMKRKLSVAGHSGQQQHNQCGKGLGLGAKSGVGEILKWVSGRWLAALKALVTQQNSRSGMGVADGALKTAEKAASNNSNTRFGLFACK